MAENLETSTPIALKMLLTILYLPNPHLFLVPLFQGKEFIAKGLL